MRVVVGFQIALLLALLAVIPSGKHLLYCDSFVYQIILFSYAVSVCESRFIRTIILHVLAVKCKCKHSLFSQ